MLELFLIRFDILGTFRCFQVHSTSRGRRSTHCQQIIRVRSLETSSNSKLPTPPLLFCLQILLTSTHRRRNLVPYARKKTVGVLEDKGSRDDKFGAGCHQQS